MVDLNNLSGREIVNLVKDHTGVDITISLKSKKSIIAKAKDIFEERNISLNDLIAEPEVSPTKKAYVALSVSVKDHKEKEIKALIKEFEDLTKKNLISFRQALLEINEID